MSDLLKIVVPMAGWATRMRPHTWNKPKPLVSVGGKPSFDHLMDMFASVPEPENAEFVFIVSPYLGELQIPAYVQAHYPQIKAHTIVQHEMKGQSHALYLAREHLRGPMIMCFSDTLIDTDFSLLEEEQTDGVAWVKPVPDPRRFGVAELDDQGWVRRFIEKPESMENNLAVVGCYYFRQGEALLAAIEEQMRRNVVLKNEFFLTDAVSIMIESGARVRTEKVDVWLDTGTIEATLETNRYLLEHGRDNSTAAERTGVTVRPPVYIHPEARVEDSVVGPHVSVGAGCAIRESQVADSILEAGVEVQSSALTGSLIGRNCRVRNAGRPDAPARLNIGDNSTVENQTV